MWRKLAVLKLPILFALGRRCGTQEKTSPVAAMKIAHGNYLKENASGYDWFANASDGYGGIPLILLRALPDLAPEIWGRPEEQFSRFGFMPNPDSPLPLSLSWHSMEPAQSPQHLHPVALTCGSSPVRRL